MKIQKKIILADRSNVREVEAETQYEFTQYVLTNIGLPGELLEDIFPEWESFSVDHKIKLREVLKKFKVMIIEDRGGGICYYVDDQKIAEWFKPTFKLKVNPKAKQPSDKYYMEIHASYWLISEDEKKS